jgi:hypothetical protein
MNVGQYIDSDEVPTKEADLLAWPKFITLWEIMKTLKMPHLITTFRQLGWANSAYQNSSTIASDELVSEFRKSLLYCRDEFKEAGLRTTYWAIIDCLQKLDRDHVTEGDIAERAFQIFKTAQWETEKIILFKVDPEDDRFRNTASEFSEQLTDRFRTAADEIESAGRCLAFGSSTACVFHLMRAVECAVKSIWGTLNLSTPKLSDSWGALLGPMDKQLSLPKDQRVHLWAAEGDFFAEAVADVRAVKKAWRDPTMHVERTYDREQAVKVFDASLGLMTHLATRLDEKGNFYPT